MKPLRSAAFLFAALLVQPGFAAAPPFETPAPVAFMKDLSSGAVLYAFQPEDVRRRWEALLDPPLSPDELATFRAHADAVRERRVELTPSPFVTGVTPAREQPVSAYRFNTFSPVEQR